MANFPLTFSFKVVAINPQVRVTDANGTLLAYAKQKAFKFKEDITIFQDEAQQRPLFRMKADRVIDWGARYLISDAAGTPIGALQREGARALWKATYHIHDRDDVRVGLIHEESGWVRMANELLEQIPMVGMFTGYVLHPAYLVDLRGETTLYMKKQPAFMEGGFSLEERMPLTAEDETLAIASSILAAMLEQWRG